MPRAKIATTTGPVGPLLAQNLYRLGHAEIVVQASKLSALVAEKTGRTMTRQRISALMNAVRIEPETVALLAQAVGVKPAELTRAVEIQAVPK